MGNVVESGTLEEIFKSPAHPYTKALLKSIPVLGRGKNQKIEPIRGMTPDPFKRPKGCQFNPRCDYCTDKCFKMPDDFKLTDTHSVRCWYYKKVLENE